MRYRLRTLLIALAVAPPLLALVWSFPWQFLFILGFSLGLATVLAVYLVALPYCFACLISGVAAFIGRISGGN